MAVNNLEITDVYQLINTLHEQATGKASIAPTNTAEFVSMANTTLAVGTDIVYDQLMKMVSRTVFASRVYGAKFQGLVKDDIQWGGIIRKISMADKDAEEDKAFHDITEGTSVDHYIRKNANILEMRFYSSADWQDFITIYRTQLKDAFVGPEQLGSFIAMVMQEMNNKWEQWFEELKRAALCNFIGAKKAVDEENVINLLEKYNEATGQSLVGTDIFKKENVKPFFEWVKAYVDTISRRFTERSGLYQFQVTGKYLNRHTPYNKQKLYISSDYLDIINTTVLTEAYHNKELQYRDIEGVGYWQSIKEPKEIKVTPSILDANGAVSVGEEQSLENVFGVLFDEDAIGVHVVDRVVVNTPLNARGLYYNTVMTANCKYTNDITEKGVVFVLF